MVTLLAYAIYCLGVKVTMKNFNLNVPELMYYCSLILILPFYTLVRLFKQDVLGVLAEDQINLTKRILAGFVADSLLFAAMNMTSYARAFALFFTNTLMSPFIAKSMLGEKVKNWDIVGIIIGFIGMLLIVQPFDDEKNKATGSWVIDVIGCVLALIAAFSSSLTLIYVSRLAKNKVHYSLISLYQMIG